MVTVYSSLGPRGRRDGDRRPAGHLQLQRQARAHLGRPAPGEQAVGVGGHDLDPLRHQPSPGHRLGGRHLVDPVAVDEIRPELAPVRDAAEPAGAAELLEDVGPPVGGHGRADAHDDLVLGGVEQPRVVLHHVESEVGGPGAEDVPPAPVPERLAGCHRGRAENGQGERRREHGGDPAGERVGGAQALALERAGDGEHTAGQQDEDERGPGVARRRVGGEAEAGEGEKDDDRRQGAAQAEREKRGRAHRRVDHQRQQQPQARVAGDVEREDVTRVGDRPGPDLAGVEGEVRPAAAVDVRCGHQRPRQQVGAERQQEQRQRPGAPAHEPGRARERAGSDRGEQRQRDARLGDAAGDDRRGRGEAGEGGHVEQGAQTVHPALTGRRERVAARAVCRSSSRRSLT